MIKRAQNFENLRKIPSKTRLSTQVDARKLKTSRIQPFTQVRQAQAQAAASTRSAAQKPFSKSFRTK
jgi:hypothetical protein